MIYEVYRNLHTKNWSIRDVKTKLIVGHADKIEMEDVRAKISESGRQRVLLEKRKNVHAFLVGRVVRVAGFTSFKGRELAKSKAGLMLRTSQMAVKYNPYKWATFMWQDTDGDKRPFRFSLYRVSLEVDGKVFT